MDFFPLVSTPAHPYVAIDPVAISIGPLDVHWYGIMYLLAFLFFWAGGNWAARRRPWLQWTGPMVGDMLFYGMIGVVVGGRLGYVLFYSLDSFLADPWFLFRITEGGMSFHGGLLGVIAAMWWYGRRCGQGFWRVADFVAPLVPIWLGLGRGGNFIGGELWGAIREAWARGELDHLARHPSQLYQAMGEGLALFLLLALYSRRPRPVGAVSGLFLVGYGAFRIVAEFFREPDAHIGFLDGNWLTLGMLLSLPMVLAGLVIMLIAYRRG